MLFFKNLGPFKLNYLLNKTAFIIKKKYPDYLISKVSNLKDAKINELTFFDNIKYEKDLSNTKASYCLIKERHLKLVPKKIVSILSKNPLLDFILIAKCFFPDSCHDLNDFEKMDRNQIKKKLKIFSQNLLIGKHVKIGKNVLVGHNTIIKDNCFIGNNVKIGSNCIISNSIIDDFVEISDNVNIGKKGFGFKKIKDTFQFIPHFGKVLIGKNTYIGSYVTIDRGSFSDTIIGNNCFLDNHVQIAHNVKIGKFCFFASQSGVAGSTNIGNNCVIGGQAGISGHLNIGDNVSIGGGSGVIRDLKNNEKVMGYPAINFKNFIKKNVN